MDSYLRYLGLVVIITGLAFWLWRSNSPQSNTQKSDPSAEEAEPDVYGKQVKFNQLNPDGSLHYRLRASEIEQYSQNEFTEMVEPNLHLLSAEQPPWDIDAELGNIKVIRSDKGTREERVELDVNVEMIQLHPENGVVTLRSQEFVIFPDRQYAETDQNVTIDTEVGRTVAASLSADLDSGLLNLSSSETQRVHTIVLPEQFKRKQRDQD